MLLAGVYFAAGKFDLSLVWPAIGIALTALQDTGSGIPAQDLAHIFKPFFRIDRTRKGSGLGLSIASEIVRMHGGEIIVESEVGSGSTFTVKLPLVQP